MFRDLWKLWSARERGRNFFLEKKKEDGKMMKN